MAGIDILNNGLRSLTGAVQKAYIQFEDERIKKGEINVTPYKSRAAGLPAGQDLGKLAKAAEAITATSAKVSDVLGGVLTGNMSNIGKSNIYEVKFNPSELSFQVYGGGPVQKQNITESGKNEWSSAEMKPRIMLQVPLLFDDYERTDAFMMEKFGDITAAARTLVSEGAKAVTGRTYSVRPQVEGFIAALRTPETRKLTFCWNKLAYTGMLEMVDATYTMFNMEGHPIRAKVTLSILITDEKVTDGNLGAFQKSYKAIFEEDGSKMGSAIQNVGNLINLKL